MAGVSVRIGADDSELNAALRRAKTGLKDLGGELRTSAVEAAKWGAALTAAGVAAGAAIVNNSIQAARELDNLSRVANTSRQTFQTWAIGARTVGIEQDKLADILKDVNDRIGDFVSTGGGPMADFFEKVAPQVGVTAEQFRKLSGPDALQLYVDSLEKANLSQAETTFYMEAMASDATALIPLLRDGGRAMQEQADQAERLGLVMSDIDSEQLLMAQQSMQEAAEIAKGFANQMAVELAPILQAVTQLFREQAAEAGGVGHAASDAFGYITDAAGFVMDAVDGVRRVFSLVADGIIAGFSKIAAVIAEDIGKTLELLDEIPGVDMSGPLESIRAFAEQSQGVVREAVENMNSTLMEEMPSIGFERFVEQARETAEVIAEERLDLASMLLGDPEQMEERGQVIADIHQGQLELALERERIAQEMMTEIEKENAAERERIAKAESRAKTQAINDFWSNATSLMNSGSRTMFEIGKAASLAQAVVDGYAAITGAYKVGASIGGPALGAAFGAAAAAATYTQIQAIRNASFGSGGSGGASSAAAAGSVTGGINAQGQAVTGQTESRQVLTVQGIDPNQMFSGRQLVDIINQAQKDGAILQVQD